MPKRGEKTRANKTWTEARFFSFIRSALRRAWSRYPIRFMALDAASRPYVGTDKRRKKEYQCAVCRAWFMQKEVEVDHIIPCGSLKNFRDLSGFAKRLFCELKDVRVVCKPCHKGITHND